MNPATRVIVRLVACLAVTAGSTLVVQPTASAYPTTDDSVLRVPLFDTTSQVTTGAAASPNSTSTSARLRLTAAAPRPPSAQEDAGPLDVTIDRLGHATLRRDRPLVVHGTVTNTSSSRRLRVQAYVQLSPNPATDLTSLHTLGATVDDVGIGSPDLTFGEYARVGTLRPGARAGFRIRVPYAHLAISGEPGVYRLGIKVLSSAPDGTRDPNAAARDNTLLPLLPIRTKRLTPVQAVTLLPLTAPVKRLTGGTFADDSLVSALATGGRLSNVLDWALTAAPDTVQVVLDPALLWAVTDMADGYRIAVRSATGPSVGGRGAAVATSWVARFDQLRSRQHVLLLPWGSPAANSLLDNGLSGPITAAVQASRDFLSRRGVGTSVAGWLPSGRSGARAVSVLRTAGAGVQIVSETSLPDVTVDEERRRPPPSRLDLVVEGRRVPVIVSAATLAGRATAADTSALQFRQRLLAEATTRSISRQTQRIAVTALPFDWDPGTTTSAQALASAFDEPVLVGQSALGALDRDGTRYDGAVRPAPGPALALAASMLSAVRELSLAGGNLASILSPSEIAERAFLRAFAMAGSAQWTTAPRLGATLVGRLAAADRAALAKVTVTGPPFVAMSSDSGRFPLTVTNGLDKPVSVRLAVVPDNPALSIAPLPTQVLPAGQRRDVRVVSTADGSGVTSVRARLATLAGRQFGTAWRFDVRATQIGLVIWVVMAIGGIVLFSAAGYRIVNRLRGHDTPRRQPAS